MPSRLPHLPAATSSSSPSKPSRRSASPFRRPTLNKPLARGPPPSFAALGLGRRSGAKRGGRGGKKSRPRERRERRESDAAAIVGEEGEDDDDDDGNDGNDGNERSMPPAGPSSSLPKSKPSKPQPKRKPGKAFSPCPRPQAGRRPFDLPRSARRQASAAEEEKEEGEESSEEESSSSDEDEVSVSPAPVVEGKRKASSGSGSGVLGAGKAKRGVWAGAGADGKKSPSSSVSSSAPAPAVGRAPGLDSKVKTDGRLVASPKIGRSPSSPTAALVLPVTPSPSPSRTPHALAGPSSRDRPAPAVNRLAPPAVQFPYMSPSPAGRRTSAPAHRSGTSGRQLAIPPAVVQSRASVALSPLPDEDDDGFGPPIPIRIPSPFAPRLPVPVVGRPQPAQSLTPAPLGPTVRSTIALGKTLRGRAAMSATAEPSIGARSTSPDKPALDDEVEKKRKRRRGETTVEHEDDKEDVGEVVKRQKKRTRTAGADDLVQGRARPTSSLSPSGMPLSTFKTYNPPLIKPEPAPSSSSFSTLAAASPSASSSSASAAVTPPPYLTGPRWFMPPSSFYFAPYQLPQRPVLGLQGWHKPLGVYPPGGGAREPPPSSSTDRVAPTDDDNEVVFLSEINVPFH